MKLKLQHLLVLSISLFVACSQRPAIPNGNGIGGNLPTANKVDRNARRPVPPHINGESKKPVYPTNGGTVNGKRGQKMTPQEIFTNYSPAVFTVFTSSGYNQFQGSGFFINSSGLAVSNYHVFEGTTIGYEVIKLQDGRTFKLKEVVYKSKEDDVFIFKVAANGASFKYLPISSKKTFVGDKAYAIGSPLGLENTFSSGEISQLRGSGTIQISVPIDHGSSGGALINEYGEAIGITTSGYDKSGANLNFAKSIDLVKPHI